MAYSDFKLNEVVKAFNLITHDVSGLFASIEEAEVSEFFRQILNENVELAVAINTEKARSEMIIAPILLELRRRLKQQIGLFSGIDFTVDPTKGLSGVCDFIISKNSEQLFLSSPIVTVVEAKNENLKSGFAQCVAEMVAAQLFNQREGNDIPVIYGVVTIGTVWRFMQLKDQNIEIDLREYYVQDINKILGILLHIASP